MVEFALSLSAGRYSGRVNSAGAMGSKFVRGWGPGSGSDSSNAAAPTAAVQGPLSTETSSTKKLLALRESLSMPKIRPISCPANALRSSASIVSEMKKARWSSDSHSRSEGGSRRV